MMTTSNFEVFVLYMFTHVIIIALGIAVYKLMFDGLIKWIFSIFDLLRTIKIKRKTVITGKKIKKGIIWYKGNKKLF